MLAVRVPENPQGEQLQGIRIMARLKFSLGLTGTNEIVVLCETYLSRMVERKATVKEGGGEISEGETVKRVRNA